MAFDINRATNFKTQLESGPIHNIIAYAQRTYPNECCGYVLENGAIFPGHNVIEILGDKTLTSKNAFLIDKHSWELADANASPIVCVYHSHTNGDPNMSDADQHMLTWHGWCYLIIGLVDTNPTSAKLFWWEDGSLNELDINL